jgi:hypothetical protein
MDEPAAVAALGSGAAAAAGQRSAVPGPARTRPQDRLQERRGDHLEGGGGKGSVLLASSTLFKTFREREVVSFDFSHPPTTIKIYIAAGLLKGVYPEIYKGN